MAKNDNLKDYLTDLYEGIKTKNPNASRNPQNFRIDIESIETGINTSDATATANDILLGKTAYVNDEKIEGTIETYKLEMSEGAISGSSVIEVSEFPTENIKEDTIYQVNETEYKGLNVFIKTGDYEPSDLMSAIRGLGSEPNLTYYLVEELPTNPQVSNLQTFNPAYVYIYNDSAYTYGNAGYGNMWIGIKDLVSSVMGIAYEDKGYVEREEECLEHGIYVTYRQGKKFGMYSKYYDLQTFYPYSYGHFMVGCWANAVIYREVIDKRVRVFSDETMLRVPEYCFASCTALTDVDLPNATEIGVYAFLGNSSLTNINIPNVVKIDNSAFSNCHDLESIYLPKIQEFMSNAFGYCKLLKAIIINQTNVVCETQGIILGGCSHILGIQDDTYNPNGDKDGYIYVPDSMVEQYKEHEDWKDYATQIKPISELPQEYKDLYGI